MTDFQDIRIGQAVIFGTQIGWALPGGQFTSDKERAVKAARYIANKLEGEKK